MAYGNGFNIGATTKDGEVVESYTEAVDNAELTQRALTEFPLSEGYHTHYAKAIGGVVVIDLWEKNECLTQPEEKSPQVEPQEFLNGLF